MPTHFIRSHTLGRRRLKWIFTKNYTSEDRIRKNRFQQHRLHPFGIELVGLPVIVRTVHHGKASSVCVLFCCLTFYGLRLSWLITWLSNIMFIRIWLAIDLIAWKFNSYHELIRLCWTTSKEREKKWNIIEWSAINYTADTFGNWWNVNTWSPDMRHRVNVSQPSVLCNGRETIREPRLKLRFWKVDGLQPLGEFLHVFSCLVSDNVTPSAINFHLRRSESEALREARSRRVHFY